MNAHRRLYLDLNPPSAATALEPAPQATSQYAPDWLLVALALALVLIQVLARIFPELDKPLLPPTAAFETPSMRIEEARIEGFRAGYALAHEQQGCNALLAQPVATE